MIQKEEKMLEAVSLHIQLARKEWEIIYIDEFKYLSYGYDLYGWTLKGRSWYRKIRLFKFNWKDYIY